MTIISSTRKQAPKKGPNQSQCESLRHYDRHYDYHYKRQHPAGSQCLPSQRWSLAVAGCNVAANICRWNRFQQTCDYVNRSASLNRAQTRLEADGSFKIILANEDPGLPNWIDTEGNVLGMVFWRFFLIEGGVETPQATVVKLSDLAQ